MPVKASEAARITGLLAGRRPSVKYEEATIEGVRMLVIVGNEVDTVIRFSRGGSADMPQLCSYPEVAESAAYAESKIRPTSGIGARAKIRPGKETSGRMIGS